MTWISYQSEKFHAFVEENISLTSPRELSQASLFTKETLL